MVRVTVTEAVPLAGRRRVTACHIVLAAILLLILIVWYPGLREWPWDALAPAITAVALVNGALLLLSGVRVWTASGAFAMVLFVFHFGLIVLLGGGVILPSDLTPYTASWMLTPSGAAAGVVVLIGWLGYVIGVQSVRLRRSGAPVARPVRLSDTRLRALAGSFGCVFMAAGVGLWLQVLRMSGGLGLAVGDYLSYLDATAEYSSILSLVWVFIALGAIHLGVAHKSWIRSLGWCVFGLFSIIALPLGLRGEVLFPLVVMGVVLARHGWKPGWKITTALLALTLIAVGVLRAVRSIGVADVSNGIGDVALWAGLAELGASLHPVEQVVLWKDGGEPLALGSTYWAPVERGITGLIPIVDRLPADQDQRLMNVVVSDRAGPIGFSIIAEAFHNFGNAGAILIMGVTGVAMACLDRLRVTPRSDLLIGVFLAPLLLHVRNSFVPVPLQLAVGLGCIASLALLARIGWQRQVAERSRRVAE